MPNVKSLENLKKGKATQFKSGERAVENGRKGGIKQGVNKKFRELAMLMFEAPASLSDADKQKVRNALNVGDDIEVDNQMLYLAKLNTILGGLKTKPEEYLHALDRAMDLTGTNTTAVMAAERIKLERERIKLEREKMEFEREKWKAENGAGGGYDEPIRIIREADGGICVEDDEP